MFTVVIVQQLLRGLPQNLRFFSNVSVTDTNQRIQAVSALCGESHAIK